MRNSEYVGATGSVALPVRACFAQGAPQPFKTYQRSPNMVALQKAKAFFSPAPLEAAENAETEKAIFGVVFKGALTLRSLRALREKNFFISCSYALRTSELA
jgi:hypothetical protein